MKDRLDFQPSPFLISKGRGLLILLIWLPMISIPVFGFQPSIEQVLINGKPQSIKEDTVTLNSYDNLTIVLNISDSLKYFYQCVRMDNNQLIVGSIIDSNFNRLMVLYPNLSKGKYSFDVSTSSQTYPNDRLTIEVKAPFLRSWLFVTILLLYLLLLFGGAIYFIILSNFRNKEKLLDLRSDWTNKLHNDIGADLSSIALRLNILKKRHLGKLNPKLQEGVEKTYSLLKSTQKKLRFVFDLVDPKKNSLQVMLAEIEDFARENFALKQIEFQYENKLKDEKVDQLNIGRINKIYLVMKEVLNNTIKHSKATHSSIQISQLKKSIQIKMQDNGKGFDPSMNHKGNGLKNLLQYGREGFIDIRFDSSPEKGTEVNILILKL